MSFQSPAEGGCGAPTFLRCEFGAGGRGHAGEIGAEGMDERRPMTRFVCLFFARRHRKSNWAEAHGVVDVWQMFH